MCHHIKTVHFEHVFLNPLNAELNPICHLLALLGAHHIFHVSGLRVKILTINGDYFPEQMAFLMLLRSLLGTR
jgi:transposase